MTLQFYSENWPSIVSQSYTCCKYHKQFMKLLSTAILADENGLNSGKLGPLSGSRPTYQNNSQVRDKPWFNISEHTRILA